MAYVDARGPIFLQAGRYVYQPSAGITLNHLDLLDLARKLNGLKDALDKAAGVNTSDDIYDSAGDSTYVSPNDPPFVYGEIVNTPCDVIDKVLLDPGKFPEGAYSFSSPYEENTRFIVAGCKDALELSAGENSSEIDHELACLPLKHVLKSEPPQMHSETDGQPTSHWGPSVSEA